MENKSKFTRLKDWFFKGRIEKKRIEKERIEILSKEYDKGEILRIGQNG